jgi:FAD/FMN-containing dehydrogenase
MVALDSPGQALDLLVLLQERCGAALTGFELMSALCLRLVAAHFPDLPRPIAAPHPQYALVELSSNESPEHAAALLEASVGAALEAGMARDAVLASSTAQSLGLWKVRESISPAQAAAGKNIKHDISLPLSAIPDFIARTDAALQAAFPGCQVVCFGHLGDGNLHYNVQAPAGVAASGFLAAHEAPINTMVYDAVQRRGGSISAEHGIGRLKREELRQRKDPTALALMQAIKRALDPLDLLNPARML